MTFLSGSENPSVSEGNEDNSTPASTSISGELFWPYLLLYVHIIHERLWFYLAREKTTNVYIY